MDALTIGIVAVGTYVPRTCIEAGEHDGDLMLIVAVGIGSA